MIGNLAGLLWQLMCRYGVQSEGRTKGIAHAQVLKAAALLTGSPSGGGLLFIFYPTFSFPLLVLRPSTT